jgi:hypothetical protein
MYEAYGMSSGSQIIKSEIKLKCRLIITREIKVTRCPEIGGCYQGLGTGLMFGIWR